MDALVDLLEGWEQEITATEEGEYGIAWHDTGHGRVLHVINYCFDNESHRIRNLKPLSFSLDKAWKRGQVSTFPENPLLEVSYGQQVLEVKNAGIYTIIEFLNA